MLQSMGSVGHRNIKLWALPRHGEHTLPPEHAEGRPARNTARCAASGAAQLRSTATPHVHTMQLRCCAALRPAPDRSTAGAPRRSSHTWRALWAWRCTSGRTARSAMSASRAVRTLYSIPQLAITRGSDASARQHRCTASPRSRTIAQGGHACTRAQGRREANARADGSESCARGCVYMVRTQGFVCDACGHQA